MIWIRNFLFCFFSHQDTTPNLFVFRSVHTWCHSYWQTERRRGISDIPSILFVMETYPETTLESSKIHQLWITGPSPPAWVPPCPWSSIGLPAHPPPSSRLPASASARPLASSTTAWPAAALLPDPISKWQEEDGFYPSQFHHHVGFGSSTIHKNMPGVEQKLNETSR